MELRKIRISDRGYVEGFTRGCEPYSDFSFTSMFSWDTEGQMLIGESGGNLIVRFSDYVTGKPFYSFIGSGDADRTAELLLARSRDEGLEQCLKLVPESAALLLDRDRFLVAEDRDHFDYVFEIADLCRMDGGRFETHRGMYNKFRKRYCDDQALEVGCKSTTAREAEAWIRTVNRQWALNKAAKGIEMEDPEASHEFSAIRRFFEVAGDDISAHCLFSGGDPVGYAVFEPLWDGQVLSHFSKADTRYVGVYSYLTLTGCAGLEKTGMKLLNCEQDLGIEGLRSSKGSFHPAHFLKKYRVSRR